MILNEALLAHGYEEEGARFMGAISVTRLNKPSSGTLQIKTEGVKSR